MFIEIRQELNLLFRMNTKISREKLQHENKLLDSCIHADSKTILFLYKTHLPGVIRYVCNNGGTVEDARDVFQEALMALYKQIKSGEFHLTASLKTYTFSICRYQWLKSIRKNRKIERIDKDIEITDLSPDIIHKLEKAERFLLLKSHLSKMSPSNQRLLNLYFQKFSTEEIADKMGLSMKYVKKKKYVCKKAPIDSIQKDPCFKVCSLGSRL